MQARKDGDGEMSTLSDEQRNKLAAWLGWEYNEEISTYRDTVAHYAFWCYEGEEMYGYDERRTWSPFAEISTGQ